MRLVHQSGFHTMCQQTWSGMLITREFTWTQVARRTRSGHFWSTSIQTGHRITMGRLHSLNETAMIPKLWQRLGHGLEDLLFSKVGDSLLYLKKVGEGE